MTAVHGGRFDLNATNHKGRRGDEEEEEDNDRGLEAWERAYAEDRSWEALEEDESGLLFPIDTKSIIHAQYRRRLLLRSAPSARIQKGLIRYLYVIIDFSKQVLRPMPLPMQQQQIGHQLAAETASSVQTNCIMTAYGGFCGDVHNTIAGARLLHADSCMDLEIYWPAY